LDGNNIVAWVTIDDKVKGTLFHSACCSKYCQYVSMPCFWPAFLIASPWELAHLHAVTRETQHKYWVLTTTDIKIIAKSHVAGCGTRGDTVLSIPLDTIIDCGMTGKHTVCSQCYDGYTKMLVQTASRNHYFIGTADSAWFVAEIIARRDIMKGHNKLSLSPLVQIAYAEMERGETKESSTDFTEHIKIV
jgi:hypothetical protein